MFSRSGIDRLVLSNYVIEKEQVGMGKAMDSAGRKLGIMQEVMAFLWERKLWWLMPSCPKNTNELKTGSPGRFGIDVSTLDWPMGARILGHEHAAPAVPSI